MKKSYQRALHSSYLGYACQAITNNLPPLLFVTFQDQFHFSLRAISTLIICNFFVQILVDGICAKYVDRLGYKRSFLIANLLSALGIASLSVFPFLFPNPFAGVLASVCLYASGGGAIEVLVTPIVQALPTRNPTRTLCITHSCYCWGHVLVVLLSTLYFLTAGIRNWRFLPLLWSMLPLTNLIFFLRAETPQLPPAQHAETAIQGSGKRIALVLAMMLCAGASEVSMAEWSSYFAETGIGVSKTIGDVLGPCLFAFLMGLARILYGSFGVRISAEKVVCISASCCFATYVTASICKVPLFALLSCGVTGFFVGVLWPGTLQLAGKWFAGGSTTLFAYMALFGDLGCGLGPAVTGLVSQTAANQISAGLLAASAFPAVLAILLMYRILSTNKEKGVKNASYYN